MYSRRSYMPFFLTLMLLLMTFSFAIAQGKGIPRNDPHFGRKKIEHTADSKTFNIFAEEDDASVSRVLSPPSDKMSKKQHALRTRVAVFNPIMFDLKLDTFKKGDKLVGELFQNEHVEFLVKDVEFIKGELWVMLIGSNTRCSANIQIEKQPLSIALYMYIEGRRYQCRYNSENRTTVLEENESSKVARKRRKEALNNLKESGPKRINLFHEKDNPTSRKKLEYFIGQEQAVVRSRGTIINPFLSQDRIDEIFVGDTLEGYLFEDVFFEADIIGKDTSGRRTVLELSIIGNSMLDNITGMIIGKEAIFLKFYMSKKNKEYVIAFSGPSNKQYIAEVDPAKLIVPREIGLHSLRSSDPSLAKKKASLKSRNSDFHEKESTSLDDIVKVDLLVAYTEDSRKYYGSILAIEYGIDKAIHVANQTFSKNSGIGVEFRLVHSYEVPKEEYDPEVNDPHKAIDILAKLNPGGKYLDDIHLERDVNGADLVILIQRLGDNTAGISKTGAWYDSEDFGASKGFAIVDDFYLNFNHTLSHELGHIFGADHSKKQPSRPGRSFSTGGAASTPFAFGWQFGGQWPVVVQPKYVTIMTYDDWDIYNNWPPAIKVSSFSNPRKYYPDYDTQTTYDLGKEDEADNASAIKINKNNISHLRDAMKEIWFGTNAWDEIREEEYAQDLFGHSVDIDGDSAIVGAPKLGVAWIFEKNKSSGEWVLKEKLSAWGSINVRGGGSEFGKQVLIDGKVAVVKSKQSVFVYERNNAGEWGQTPGLNEINDYYGVKAKGYRWPNNYLSLSWPDNPQTVREAEGEYASDYWAIGEVDLAGDYIIVSCGKNNYLNHSNEYKGRVYIYKRNGFGWWQWKEWCTKVMGVRSAMYCAKIESDDPGFGNSVSIDKLGNIAVGSYIVC